MLVKTLGTGAIGGIVGAALAAAFFAEPIQRFWLADDDTDARLATIEASIAELSSIPAPDVDLSPITSQIDDGFSRIEALENRFKRLETRDPASVVPELAPHLTPLWSQIETQTERLAGLEASLNALPDDLTSVDEKLAAIENHVDERILKLEARLALLETRIRVGDGSDGRIAASALLVGNLRDALENGEDFSDSLERLANLVKDDEFLSKLVEQLQPHSDGVATLAELEASLLTLERTDSFANYDAEATDWIANTVGNLKSLVNVRKKGSLDQHPLGQALRALEAGELETAIQYLQPLEDAGNADARQWRLQASARLFVLEAIGSLDQAIRNLLAGPDPS